MVHRFVVRQPDAFARVATAETAGLLARFPVRTPLSQIGAVQAGGGSGR